MSPQHEQRKKVLDQLSELTPEDIDTLRDLARLLQSGRKTIWKTMVQWATLAILGALSWGIVEYLRNKLK